MRDNPGRWLIGYGLFLLAMGTAGYLWNPEKAVTALLSGSAFGGLSMLWGWLCLRGSAWSRWAALTTTGLLVVVFCWRATVGWMAVAAGAPEKRVPAILITAMGLASLAMLSRLINRPGRRRPD